jgi:hypothetical protein
MQRILTLIAILITCQIASAQTNVETDKEINFRITISDSDASNAKSLKSLEFGKLEKGESRNTFTISSLKSQMLNLEQELRRIFPSVIIKEDTATQD